MEDIAGHKRPREENGSFCNKQWRVVHRTGNADVIGASSLDSIREARRSDNSDSFMQKVDESDAELPAPSEQHLDSTHYAFGFPFPSRCNASCASNPGPSSAATTRPAINRTSYTAPLARLGDLSLLELQHQLIQLDILEQELLCDLRCARREYEARVAALGGGGGREPSDVPYRAASAFSIVAAPLHCPFTQRQQQQQKQHCPQLPPLGPTSTAIPPATMKTHGGSEHPRSGSGVMGPEAPQPITGAGPMPPPPPRRPSGHSQQPWPPSQQFSQLQQLQDQHQQQQMQMQHQHQAERDRRGRARRAQPLPPKAPSARVAAPEQCATAL